MGFWKLARVGEDVLRGRVGRPSGVSETGCVASGKLFPLLSASVYLCNGNNTSYFHSCENEKDIMDVNQPA